MFPLVLIELSSTRFKLCLHLTIILNVLSKAAACNDTRSTCKVAISFSLAIVAENSAFYYLLNVLAWQSDRAQENGE